MKQTTTETIAAALKERFDDFAHRQEFTPAQVREVCESMGIKPDYKILEQSSKVRWGVYKFGGLVGKTAPKVAAKRTAVEVPPEPPRVVQQIQEAAPVLQCAKGESVNFNDSFAYVPKVDPDYVPFGDYQDIEDIIRTKMFYPVLITGHSGNGKTMTIEQACAKLKQPLIRINCTKKTDEESLIGSKTLIDGNVVIKEGPMLIAMRSGATILLDEFSCSDPSLIMCLQGILEGKPYYFALSGEFVVPKLGFNVFLTDNTKGQGSEDGRYIGTNILNEAFLERIAATIQQDFPPAAIERRIIQKRLTTKGVPDQKFAEQLVAWAGAIRATFKDGGVDSCISTRRLGHIVDNYAIFKNRDKAVRQCTNRFNEMTQSAFVKLWESITPPEKNDAHSADPLAEPKIVVVS